MAVRDGRDWHPTLLAVTEHLLSGGFELGTRLAERREIHDARADTGGQLELHALPLRLEDEPSGWATDGVIRVLPCMPVFRGDGALRPGEDSVEKGVDDVEASCCLMPVCLAFVLPPRAKRRKTARAFSKSDAVIR